MTAAKFKFICIRAGFWQWRKYYLIRQRGGRWVAEWAFKQGNGKKITQIRPQKSYPKLANLLAEAEQLGLLHEGN